MPSFGLTSSTAGTALLLPSLSPSLSSFPFSVSRRGSFLLRRVPSAMPASQLSRGKKEGSREWGGSVPTPLADPPISSYPEGLVSPHVRRRWLFGNIIEGCHCRKGNPCPPPSPPSHPFSPPTHRASPTGAAELFLRVSYPSVKAFSRYQ